MGHKSKKFVSRDVFPPPTKQRPAGGVSLRPRILHYDSPLEEAAQSSRVRFWWTLQSAQRLGEMPRNVRDVDRHASFQALEW